MTSKRMLLSVMVGAILALMTVASTAQAAVAGNGVISGSGTSYTMVVTNTGTDTIRCMRWFAPSGTTVPSANGPGTTSTFGTAPGQSATFTFTTSQALSANNNGQLHLSSDCVSDVTGSLSGPTSGNVPCNCISLNGRIVPKTIKITNPGKSGGIKLEFSVAWFMNCGSGTGGCTGQFELFPPQPAKKLKTRLKPVSGRINCVADCAGSKTGVAHFTLIGGPALGNPKRNGKSFSLSMKRTCQGKAIAAQKFVLVFNKIGLVDKKKSRLK
jgi:hypothetical protein